MYAVDDLFAVKINSLMFVNADPTLSDEPGFISDVIEAVDQNQHVQRKMANIMLKGLPEVGKTTVQRKMANIMLKGLPEVGKTTVQRKMANIMLKGLPEVGKTTVQRKMANIMLKGLPEVGKTTVLNRLLKRPF